MFYAKSDPVESIKEHTDELLKQFDIIKEYYEQDINKKLTMNNERFWYLLYIACQYHDMGKCYTNFQNIIRSKIGKEKLQDNIGVYIPHGYLSPSFIPYNELDLSKDEKTLLVQSIAYHHERDKEPDRNLICRIIKEDLRPNLDKIQNEMGIKIDNLNTKYTKELEPQLRITNKNKYYKDYIMLKGLLHRIDHSASAHQIIEEKVTQEIPDLTNFYICNNLHAHLRDAQTFAKNNKDSNLLLIASTGIGKTETALLWLDNKKGFFTLPLRVSINALYSRVKDKIKYESLGLLHSTSLDYLEEQSEDDSEKIYEQSRLLSKKITFSTIDQLFKFPFKYRGYEKIYSTLAYSKVVIDEIQGYSPEICAVILKGIEMLNDIGGKFMIMTATLPRIYKDYLKEKGIDIKEATYLTNVIRHKLKIVDESIENDIPKIIEKGKSNKVLVIVNTVKKAMEIYNKIQDEKIINLNVNMLHSMFIQQDRAMLEQKIKNFSDDTDINGDKLSKRESGIWITTQIVEASLDIDFDYLFTEATTLDSLFQRLGRCYRKRVFDKDEPNVYIYTLNPTGVKTIYDEEILNRSIDYINNYDDALITEENKVNLVDDLYSKESINNTRFYKKFKTAMDYLDCIIDYGLTKTQAQDVLRDIDSVNVIPHDIYVKNLYLFENYKSCEREKRRIVRREINKLTLSIPSYKCKKHISSIEGFKDLYILNTKYNCTTGVLLNELTDNIF